MPSPRTVSTATGPSNSLKSLFLIKTDRIGSKRDSYSREFAKEKMDLLAEAKSEKFSAIKSYPSEGTFYNLLSFISRDLKACGNMSHVLSHGVTICVAPHISYCITSNYAHVIMSFNQMFRRGKDLVVGFRSY